MAELFDYRQDRWAPELRSIGFHLGKFIYLLDAYDDLEHDQRKGAYNPLKALSQQPGYEEEMKEILSCCWRSVPRALNACPAWRTQTCCATSFTPAYGSNTTAKQPSRPAAVAECGFVLIFPRQYGRL